MSIETVINMKQKISRRTIIYHNKTQILTSHHSHSCGFDYQSLVEIFKPHQIEVAYDGLIKNI